MTSVSPSKAHYTDSKWSSGSKLPIKTHFNFFSEKKKKRKSLRESDQQSDLEYFNLVRQNSVIAALG